MKLVYRLLFSLHVFVGLGAMVGGMSAIINPNKPMGTTVDILNNSPFSNFLIPGIILFTIIGLGNIFSAIMFKFKLKYQGYISSVFSWALVIFIVVQCIMLSMILPPHIVFFIIGLIQALLSTILLFEKRLFPVNYILNFFEGIRRKSDEMN